MPVFNESPARPSSSAWMSQRRATTGHSAPPSKKRHRWVLMVDDQHPFRECAADELRGAGVRVVEASGVYDALRLARGREIDLLVIGGQQRHQSGWLCASKLCGQPPWKKVVLYFGYPSKHDRRWSQASELAALVETRGHVKPLVASILLNLGQLSPADLGKAVA